jgi:uncharacterized protein
MIIADRALSRFTHGHGDASLVVLAEQLGHGRILTVDRRDFNVYRWSDRIPFENQLMR